MSEFKFFPKTVIWEITFACNMRCLHCGTSAGKKRPDELTTEEALSLIDDLVKEGSQEIMLSGGEPLIRPDWRDLARRVVSIGARVYMISNGMLITEEIVDDFIDIGFTNIGISFDGTKETHNYIRQNPQSFDKATQAFRIMADKGIRFCAVSQISNLNLGEMDDIRQILIDNGCKDWRIQMTTSTGRMQDHSDLVMSLDNYPKLIDKILEFQKMGEVSIDVGENIGYFGCKGSELLDGMPYLGCYAGLRAVGIESNGNIKGCLSMQPQFIEGNIRDSSFSEIWNNPDGFAYNRKFTRETAEGACHDCKYLPLCRGGCTTTSVSATGKRADNPYCIYQLECKQGITCEDDPHVTEILKRFEEPKKAV